MDIEQKLYDSNGEELPNRVTYTRSFTYDVAEVMKSYRDVHGQDTDFTQDDILQMILNFALEDFGGCRPKELTETLIYTDREETQ
jgi:hypothetical protein